MKKIKTVVVFKKKPSEKNFKNRSVSFSSHEEFQHVQKTDDVEIEVYHEGGMTRVKMSGQTFRETIKEVTMRNTGKKIFTLKY